MAFGRMLAVLRQCTNISTVKLLPLKTLFPQSMTVRGSKMAPNDDITWYNKLGIPRVYSYRESVRAVTAAAMIMFGSIGWALYSKGLKVDTVYRNQTQNANSSQKTDLPEPRLILINQKYKPWPELQAVLDRMKKEKYKRVQGTPTTR